MRKSRDGKVLGNAKVAVTKLEEKISSCQTVTQSGLRPFTVCSVLPLSNFFTHGIVTLLSIFHVSHRKSLEIRSWTGLSVLFQNLYKFTFMLVER